MREYPGQPRIAPFPNRPPCVNILNRKERDMTSGFNILYMGLPPTR